MNRSISFALLSILAVVLLPWNGAQAAASAQADDPTDHGFDGHHMDHNLVLPQIALGSHYTTRVLLLNMGNDQSMPWATEQALKTSGTVHFFHQDGSPFAAGVNGAAPSPEYGFTLQEGETLSLTLTATGEDTPGWALIEVNDDPAQDSSWGMMDGSSMQRGRRLMATAFYTLRNDQGTLVSEVGVLPALFEQGMFMNTVLPVLNESATRTGVALVNTSDQTVTVTLNLRGPDGTSMTHADRTLEPGEQIAEFADELFEGLVPEGFQGSIEVSADGQDVVVLGLLMSDGVLTSIPTRHYGQWQSSDGHMGGGMQVQLPR